MELVRNEDKIDELKERARKIVSEMTLEEKVFQTLHKAPAVERLGIDAYNWWNEALHGVARAGVATVFPQAISLAAAFDEDFIEEIADAIATEARAKYNAQKKYGDTDIYKGLTFFSPNVNIFRDPRWGRGHETYGEDPYLTSRLGVRFIEGLQGHDEKYMKAAACAKHFAVHSGPEDIRHSFDAIADNQDMFETYLPAFKACVEEAKVESVMGAYNRVNGAPCCGNSILINDILRDTWNFDGFFVSDCWAIKDFHEGHKVTKTPLESVALAMNTGCDLNCGNIFIYLLEAVQEGLVKEERLDEALTRLFVTRMKLGILDNPEGTCYDSIPYDVVDSKEMQELNLKAAEKCIVLLKNENNMLPLDKTKIKTIGIIGPNANNRKALVGNYEGTASKYYTVTEGIQEYVGDDVRILVSEGCHLYKKNVCNLGVANDRVSEVKAVCEQSDVVVMCLGLDPGLEGEEGDEGNEYASGDKPNLDLPGMQNEILKVAYASGKPVVLVLMSGSALAVNWADEHIPAILQCWYPGAQGGRAIAKVLFGDKNPEGKLPITFYSSTDDLPEFTDYSMKNRTYRYMTKEALYPFGYGLSYTNYEYTDLTVLSDDITKENIKVSVNVANTGSTDGIETVQLYIKANMEGTPNAQLKGIKKVALKAGESRKITFDIPTEAFALADKAGIKTVAAGRYTIYAGGSQPDSRSEKLTGKKVPSTEIAIESNVVFR